MLFKQGKGLCDSLALSLMELEKHLGHYNT